MTNDVKTRVVADDIEGKVHVGITYDAEPVLKQNAIERANFTGYRGKNLVKVASLHPGDVQRLANMGYDITSPDPEEVKRALLFIQSEQKSLMTVPGRPIARKKLKWL